MKKIILISSLLLMVSCKYDNLGKVLEGAAVNVDSSDLNGDNVSCLNQQLSKLNGQINNLPNKDRIKMVNEVVKYKIDTVQIFRDKKVQTISGIKSVLNYINEYGYTITKVLSNNLKVEGRAPQMTISKTDKTLKFFVEYTEDKTLVRNYNTNSVNAFDETSNVEEAINNPEIWSNRINAQVTNVCGTLISINQLIEIIKQ